MSIVKEIELSGQNSVSTLSGSIRLEEGLGRLVVYGESGNVLNVVDRNGYTFSDGTDRRIRLGRSSIDEAGLWISKPGVDIIDEIGE